MLAMDLNTPGFIAAMTTEITRIIKGTGGNIVEVVGYELAKGGGWSVILDSEYAALKVYYTYRNNKAIHLSKGPFGWVVSVRPS